MEEPVPAQCRVEAWRPPIPGISEVFHASIVGYGYPTHCHDTWTVLIVDNGAISYELDTRRCGAAGRTVAILPPGVTHNGKPAPGTAGFTKRVLYLEAGFLPKEMIGAAVDKTNIDDHALRRALVGLHDELVKGPDPFGADSCLTMIADRISRHLARRDTDASPHEAGVAQKLRELLDASIEEPVTLGGAAELLGRTKPHLVRSFRAAYGVTPHAYLIGRRVEAARNLLLDGIAPADTAHAVGFYDQAHLTRHFKRHTAVPPATYARSHREASE